MTATVQPESNSPSRRALLAGALGGLGAWAASAVGRASPVSATDGQTVVVGEEYTATSWTRITNFSNVNPVLRMESTSGIAIYAASAQSIGVLAAATTGTGLHASATSGLALEAAGRAKFSTSGVATITAGHTSKVVSPGVNVTTSSFVLLTPKVKLSGRDLWFTTDAANNKFTIRMSSSRSSGTKVAWLLLG